MNNPSVIVIPNNNNPKGFMKELIEWCERKRTSSMCDDKIKPLTSSVGFSKN